MQQKRILFEKSEIIRKQVLQLLRVPRKVVMNVNMPCGYLYSPHVLDERSNLFLVLELRSIKDRYPSGWQRPIWSNSDRNIKLWHVVIRRGAYEVKLCVHERFRNAR